MGLHEFELVHKPKRQPARPEGLAGGNRVWDKVRRPGMGYRVQLSWDGQRLGGAIFGENVHLEAFAGQLSGSVASSGRALTLRAQLEGGRLQPVGLDPGARAVLELRGEGSASGPFDLGGQVLPVEIGFPAWVLAVAALTADGAARNAWRVLLDSCTGWAGA